MRYLLAWLALAIVIAGATGSVNWLEYQRLASNGVVIEGSVKDLLPKQHQYVEYEYSVNGVAYRNRAHSWPPNPAFRDLSIGQAVTAYYDPAEPSRSVLGQPDAILRHEMRSIILAILIFPTIAVLSWAWRERRNG